VENAGTSHPPLSHLHFPPPLARYFTPRLCLGISPHTHKETFRRKRKCVYACVRVSAAALHRLLNSPQYFLHP